MDIIDVTNSQNITLHGALYDVENKNICVLLIPGMAGNIIENKFIRVLGEEFQKNNIGFVCGHNQGSFHIVDYPLANGGVFVRRGVAFEKFDDCLFDISAYVKYIENLGYRKIVIIGHSLGANKVIYCLSQRKLKSVEAYVLLGAPDMGYEVNTIEGKDDLLAEAKLNIKNGEPNKILSKLVWDCYILSSERFVDLVENKNSQNLPITSSIGSFDALKSIKLPFLAVAGEYDDSCSDDINNYLSLLVQNSGYKGEQSIIKGADHKYIGKEYELFETLYSFIVKLD